MKDTYFFPHDFDARNDPKLQNVLMEHGCEGLGVFWCVVEMMYEQGGALQLCNCKSIAFALHVDSKIVDSIVNDFGLFENDSESFWSDSINTRLNRRAEIAAKRKTAALSSWQSRRQEQTQSKCNANVMDCNAIKRKEIKEKDNILLSNESKRKNAKRFIAPTIEEVKNYISEKGYSVDAEAFCAFYESKGWFVGTTKMKSWQAAIITWSKRNASIRKAPEKTNAIWEQ